MADNFFGKFKKVLGFDEDYDDDYDYDDYDYNEEEEEVEKLPEVSTVRTRKSSNSTTSLHSSRDMIITVHEPLTYDDAPSIIDDLRADKSIVLNFEQLDIDVKRQIFDFVNGAIYALDGEIKNVNKDIFVIAPHNVEIEGLKDELKNSGVLPW